MDLDPPSRQPDHQAPLPLGELGEGKSPQTPFPSGDRLPAGGPNEAAEDVVPEVSAPSKSTADPDEASQTAPDQYPAWLPDYLLRVLGPRIVQSLLRKFAGAVRADELPGVIDLAAAKMLSAERVDTLSQAALARVFYAYCWHVTQEFAASAWCRQRQREQSLTSEELDQLGAAAGPPTSETVGESDAMASHEQELVDKTLQTLFERDLEILQRIRASPTGKISAPDLASDFGITVNAARKAIQRARQRFREAYQRFEEEDGRGEDAAREQG
jgi:hypothetical protein